MAAVKGAFTCVKTTEILHLLCLAQVDVAVTLNVKTQPDVIT